MRKKKANKIKENIVLSIKYAGFKEELSLLEESSSLKGRRQNKLLKEIDGVKRLINNIEQNNEENSYSLVVNDKLELELKKLSKQKAFEFIKYEVAIQLVFDKHFDQKLNKKLFQDISIILFNDFNKINIIEQEYNKVKKVLLFNEDSEGQKEDVIGDLLLPTVVKNENYIIAYKLGTRLLKRIINRNKIKKHIKEINKNFKNLLILDAMTILFAKEYYKDNLKELNSFYKRIFKDINLKRHYLMKEIFEQQHLSDSNSYKMKLFQNFDKYILEQIQ